jgi:hypothetical protein
MRALCDHTAEERNQTEEEMLKPLTKDELEIVIMNNKKILRKLGYDSSYI